MQSALRSAERMVDVFDRTATLNFTCVLRVRGPLSEVALNAALRRLEQRHPLLRARIERHAGAPVFVMNEAAPIPLHVLDGDRADWQRVAEQSLEQRVWADEGPRAELTWLRHGAEHSTLLLALHHVVSDGHSGFVALRDLLGLLAEPELLHSVSPQAGAPLAPGAVSCAAWAARAAQWLAGFARAHKPQQLRKESAPRAPHSPRLGMITFDAEQTERMRERTRAARASLHGLVCAAFAKGYVQAGDWERAPLRVCHPVDLRRYLDCTKHSKTTRYADAVGCFVSSVETEHVVSADTSLPQLAQQITQSIRDKKQADGPLLTASLAGVGSWLTRDASGKPELARLGDVVERYVMLDSFGVTSLGSVERIGLEPQVGLLSVEDAFFVSGASVVTAITAATSIYAGKLTIGLQWVEPLVSTATAEHILACIEHELATFAWSEANTAYAAAEQPHVAHDRLQRAV
jgi:NRPS condensation-like uncharacterized protein